MCYCEKLTMHRNLAVYNLPRRTLEEHDGFNHMVVAYKCPLTFKMPYCIPSSMSPVEHIKPSEQMQSTYWRVWRLIDMWRQQCWPTPMVTSNWEFLLGPTLWLKQPNNPLHLDVSNTQGRDPNVITVDVSTDGSTNAAFMDKIPSNTNLIDALIVLLDSSSGFAVTTVTNSNGNYVLYKLPGGSYRVSETNIALYPLYVSNSYSGVEQHNLRNNWFGDRSELHWQRLCRQACLHHLGPGVGVYKQR